MKSGQVQADNLEYDRTKPGRAISIAPLHKATVMKTSNTIMLDSHSGVVSPAIGLGATRTRESRRRMIAVAIGVQALLLAAGWMFTFSEVRSRVGEKFKDQIVDTNKATAEAVSSKLAERITGAITYESADWETAQSVIESLRMPAGGFACMVDDDGKILCHPDIREEPGLREVRLGTERLADDAGGKTTTLTDLPRTGVSTGQVVFNGLVMHYVATTYLPGMKARLLVHQPEEGLLSAGEASTTGLLWIALGIGSVVLLSTGLTTARLMRRHDRQLEKINTGLEGEVTRRVDQAMTFRDSLILGLAKLADYRDTDTGTHLERIAEYTELLARQLRATNAEIDDAYIRCLRVASSMHDIGKVGVEDAVLLKPGRLTDEERARMQRHPIMGADTLLAIREKMGHDDLVEMAIVVTLEHHERWDGKGYPLGIAGDQIQLPARIVALADVYDALTSKRVYKDAMSHEAAAANIVKESGTQFDPMVVDAFVSCATKFAEARSRLQPTQADAPVVKLAA